MEVTMETPRRPRRVRRGLVFEPDETFEWALWCLKHDPKRWAAISDRAKLAVKYYALARAAWMAADDEPAGGEGRDA